MWLEVGETNDIMVDAMYQEPQCDGSSVSGARKWLEVVETEDCMAEAVCKEPGCGWR